MKLKSFIKNFNEKRRIAFLKKETLKHDYHFEDVSIISSDCIGGILYHDLGAKFLSPTINVSFKGSGFYCFVLNLKRYINSDISIVMNDGSIIGKIEGNSLLENCPDIYVNFVHYSTIEEARDSWNSRKARINYNKIRVISTERMLTQEKLNLFNAITYKKVMIYGNVVDNINVPNGKEFVPSKFITKRNYRGKLLVFKGIGKKRHFDDLKFDFLSFLQ